MYAGYNLEITILKSYGISHLTWFFFFRIILATVEPMHFHINFRISLLISTKYPAGIFTGNGIESIINLGSVNFSSILSLQVCEYGISIYLGL